MSEIRLERLLAAPPTAVWAAWTDPALLSRWFCPNPDLELEVTADAVVGGGYRVDMGAGRYVAQGRYTELRPAEVVELTWAWETSPEEVSVVRVELTPAPDGGTRLVLVHSGLTDEDDATGHGEGWELSLARLAGLVAEERDPAERA